MGEKFRLHLWVTDMPDAAVYEVVVNVDKGHQDKNVSFEAAVGIVQHLVYANKHK